MSKFYIKTFGCQMNKSDSERIAAVFESLNFEPAKDIEQADFVVVNACSVRKSAIDRAWGMAKIFAKRKNVKIMLTGCILSTDKPKLTERFDFVFNIKDLQQLKGFLQKRTPLCHVEAFEVRHGNYFSVKPQYASKSQAFIPIMTGCNNYCSYCVVPYVRGREESRPVQQVLNEIKDLAEKGYQEIHLLGQNVNSYSPLEYKYCSGNPFENKFAKLLWEVNQIDGIQRVNFLSSHPKDMHDDIIQALKLPKQMNYLHLALQSGDNDVLKAMNRKYTAAQYTKIVQKVRQAKPDIEIGTDIIVGFPGETKEQFENTLKFCKKIKFNIAYVSMYSERKGTAAAQLDDNVPYKEKKRRWQELDKLVRMISLEKK